MNVNLNPRRRLEELTGDGPTLALVVLFALNGVDELARVSFAVAAPTLAEYFDVGMFGVTAPLVAAFALALAVSVPIAGLADRGSRVRVALLGGAGFAVFCVLIGLSLNIWMLAFAMAGSQIGRAMAEASHNSLLTDYYPVEARSRVFSFHRGGNAVGALIGGVMAGYIMQSFGWRVPFFVIAVPAAVAVLAGTTLREPVRGAQERKLAGASDAVAEMEEAPPSLAEGWRMCWQIDSLRRIYRTMPFLTPAFVGFLIFSTFMYANVFDLGPAARGWVVGLVEGPSQLLGLLVGTRIGAKLFATDPQRVSRVVQKAFVLASVAVLVFAWSPNAASAILANVVVSACLAFVVPTSFAALSLAIPPRARSIGFAMASMFVLVGLTTIPVISMAANSWGPRWGITLLAPLLLVGGMAVGTSADLLPRDIAQVWTAAAARSEVLLARREGRSKQLLVRALDVSYGDVQVLFGVDFEIEQGEIVALLGTNGAGKSTLLKAICGLVPAQKGAVILDGRDITYAPPHEIAPRGVVLVPGGQSTFPSLTVAENLRAASWIDRRDKALVAERIDATLDLFPVLRDMQHLPAANLSGGQQQMLGLGMAFLSRPELVLIDELSLGLAPVIVEQLAGIIRQLRDQGTTVVLVEQSVNVALTLAETAYFMEKGEIRFRGPTAELLERPDLLRSVFLRSNGSDKPAAAPAAQDQEAGAPAGPALELAGVTRSFGGIRAVDDVSLTLVEGEIVGIIGPNGAGKTTLFDLVSGFVPLDRGTICLAGTDVGHLPADQRARQGLGRSFQDARLFPALTVEQCIAVALDRWVTVRDPIRPALHLPAAFDSQQTVRQQVDELVETLGLDEFRGKFVHELSTGTRRIVDLACLAAQRPSVVLLDEPSSGIAQRETEALVPVLLRMREQLGASLLVVEHDMPLVTAVADRLVALDLGRVIAAGPPDAVLHEPAVVASYLGTDATLINRSGPLAAT